jgi:hypothetical protein
MKRLYFCVLRHGQSRALTLVWPVDAVWSCRRMRRIVLRLDAIWRFIFHAEFFHANERYVHAQLFNELR